MYKDMVKNVVRINITLSAEDYEELQKLKELTHRNTSNIFSIALKYYLQHAKPKSPFEE